MNHTICLHLGSNLGSRLINLEQATLGISQTIGQITKKSAIYQTQAWGEKEQPDFLNQTILATTKLSPLDLLRNMLKIEEKMGRIREKKWGPRIIDIDLLFYDDLILETPELTIPHPHISRRNFVLIPTMEVFGNFIHPVFKLSIEELYLRCRDQGEVYLSEANNPD